MERQATINARFGHRILRAASGRGLDPAALLLRAGVELPDVAAADARIPAEAYLRLWSAAMTVVGDAAFPLDVATDVRASLHDVMGFAFMTAENLGEALARAVRYLAIFTDSARWHRTLEQGVTRFTLQRRGGRGPAGAGDPRWQPGDLFALAELVVGGRQVTGVHLVPREVILTGPPPADRARFDAFFGAPIAFGARETSWTLDDAALALPLQKADPELLAYFDRQAEALLGRFDDEDVVQHVRHLAMQTLGSEMLNVRRAATRLGVSTRSLHRQLQKRGVTFQKLVDEVRAAVAQKHLADPKLSIGEVAFLLGYSDTTAFHRAFLRWTGMTPQTFRGQRELSPRLAERARA